MIRWPREGVRASLLTEFVLGLSIILSGAVCAVGIRGIAMRPGTPPPRVTQELREPQHNALGLTQEQLDDEEAVLRAYEQFLRDFFPPPVETTYGFGECPENVLGMTQAISTEGGWRLHVTLTRGMGWQLLVHILLHEHSHVFTFHPQFGGWLEPGHGQEWGATASLIWMTLVGER